MREIIKLASTGKNKKGKPTGTFRTTTKNKRTSTEKRKTKHFDARAYNTETGKCGMHVIFEETKLS
jgi:large subunit ribosomal protein L33